MTAARTDVRPTARPAPRWDSGGGSAPGIATAGRHALGTSARVVVWPRQHLDAATEAVDDVLHRLDLQASRFRPDSEISRIARAGGGLFYVSTGLAEAIEVALAAARWTGGLVDPTVGGSLAALGYDRDFAAVGADHPTPARPTPAPGWRSVTIGGRLLTRGPEVRLDLGATAKGLGADRAVRAVRRATGADGGVLVSLGGDLAVAGAPPVGGWPILVTDDEAAPSSDASQVVRLTAGALATSSVTTRRWRRAGRDLHHLVDPASGMPVDGPWRTVSVAAWTCAEANAASTAALVGGRGATRWLERAGLPARLVAHGGAVQLLGGWPADDGGRIELPAAARGPVSRALARSAR